MNQKGFAPIILIITVLFIIGVIGVFNLQKSSKLRQSTQEAQQTSSSKFPITFLDKLIPKNAYDFVQGRSQPCQSELFDPLAARNKEVKRNGSPSEFYSLEGGKYEIMYPPDPGVGAMETFVYPKELLEVLPNSYEYTKYSYSCASSESFAIELKKNNERQALYTHVETSTILPGGKKIFLINNIKKSDGTWERLKRIIDIETNKAVNLPNMECMEVLGPVVGDKFLTYSDKNHALGESKNDLHYKTKMCIWNQQGELLNQMEATFVWRAISEDFLDVKIGFLPKDPNVLYFYGRDSSNESSQCKLYLQDITFPEKHNIYNVPSINALFGRDDLAFCTDKKIDAENIKYDQ